MFKHIFLNLKRIESNEKTTKTSECTKSGKQLNDVFIVNLGLCSDVQVKSETSSAPQPPPSLNLQRVSMHAPCRIIFFLC